MLSQMEELPLERHRAGLLCAQIGDLLPCRPTASLLLGSLMSPDVIGEERRTESGPGGSGNQPQGYPKSLMVSALVNSHLRDLLPPSQEQTQHFAAMKERCMLPSQALLRVLLTPKLSPLANHPPLTSQFSPKELASLPSQLCAC